MAINYGVAGVRQLITGVVASVIEFPAPIACRLNRVFVRIALANAAGDTVFDINVNGETIYADPADRPKILAGETSIEAFMDVELNEGNMVSVDLDSTPLGGITGLYVIVQLQDAPTVTQYVKDAYNGALNRDPDGTELSDALVDLGAACAGNTTLAQTKIFFDGLFTLTEYTSLATTDAEYIEDLFNAILGRPSDPGGYAFWFGQLDDAILTRQQIRDSFNACTEHVNQRVLGWCPNTLPLTNAIQLQGIPVEGGVPDDGDTLIYDDATGLWIHTAPSSIPFTLVVAISDEITDLTVGAGKLTFRMPSAVDITLVRASLSTASSSGASAFDVNKNGSSIFSTTLTIDATEKTSVTAATAAVLTATPIVIAADDEITIDIDTAGTGAKGAKIALIGTYQ